MKYLSYTFIFINCFIFKIGYSQVLNWSSATKTGSTYTGTGIKAIITSNAVSFGDGTPRVDNVTTKGACYLGLALYAGFFSSYKSSTNSHITTTFSFESGYGCSEVTFTIKDINSEESNTTFCDVLELSATYGNTGTPLSVANIVTTLASNVNRSTSPTIVKLVGHSSSTETTGSYSAGSSCALTPVTFKPPTGSPLNTITLKYRPAYGTKKADAYYNVDPKPAAQFVSYSNLSFAATSGCVVLPVELVSFNAKRFNNVVKLNWKTASEKNNDYFLLERSVDGINFQELANIPGNGNSSNINNYQAVDDKLSNDVTYYRLKQVDFNSAYKYSDIISVDVDNAKPLLSHIFPNPTSSNIDFNFYTPVKGELYYDITDLTGRVLLTEKIGIDEGNTVLTALTNELPNGIYFLKVTFDKANYVSINKIFKN